MSGVSTPRLFTDAWRVFLLQTDAGAVNGNEYVYPCADPQDNLTNDPPPGTGNYLWTPAGEPPGASPGHKCWFPIGVQYDSDTGSMTIWLSLSYTTDGGSCNLKDVTFKLYGSTNVGMLRALEGLTGGTAISAGSFGNAVFPPPTFPKTFDLQTRPSPSNGNQGWNGFGIAIVLDNGAPQGYNLYYPEQATLTGTDPSIDPLKSTTIMPILVPPDMP